MSSQIPRWVRSEGSPLLLLEEDLLPKWGGVRACLSQDHQRVGADYDRACQMGGDYWGVLPIDSNRHAIVLGGGPVDATWVLVHEPMVAGLLVHVQYGPSDEEVLREVKRLPAEDFSCRNPDLSIECSRLRLFEAAFHGSDLMTSAVIVLPVGRYRVDTAEHWPESMGLVVHRFTRIANY